MSYAVKERYYTLQGEGAQAGRAAVLLRFAGCNLWSGTDSDRFKGPGGCAAWCDTDFVGTTGPGGGRFQTASDLADAVARTWPHRSTERSLVVCTGGEPLLQLDEALVAALHDKGFEVAVETNGTRPSTRGLDWLCVSPKAGADLVLRAGNELKLVFPQQGAEPDRFEDLDFAHFFLQPMDGPSRARNTERAVAYCLEHPRWRLSLQTHKLVGLP
jgi:7-carboxy-7-deazaguanine synthase (Cx14CxxC type)